MLRLTLPVMGAQSLCLAAVLGGNNCSRALTTESGLSCTLVQQQSAQPELSTYILPLQLAVKDVQ